MPREFSRADRVADQIQRELAQLIQREVKDPRLGMVNISEVRVTRDFGYADIYITLLSTEELSEDSEQVQTSLEVLHRASGFLRGHLGKSMRMRVVPQLRFRFDRLAGQSRHMESLIREAVASDRRQQGEDDPEDGGRE
ncbi:MAG: 30S ribosome-binding factor RbfA [Pseudomonadota bacterium]